MEVFFRRPAAVMFSQRGICWDGDNTGTITPETVSGQVVDVIFAAFTGDNLFVADNQYPYLQELVINGSTTLTNIQVPAMTIAKEVQFVGCTQANLTVTGAALVDVYLDNCSYVNVNIAVNVSNSIHFVDCTATGILTVALTGTLATFVVDNCAFSGLAVTLPSGLTTLQVTSCASITSLPTLPATITTLDASGSRLRQASVDAILAALVANGLSNGTVNLSGCTWPSSAGLASKTTLEGLGWTVTVTATPTFFDQDFAGDGDSFECTLSLSVTGTPVGDLYVQYKLNGGTAAEQLLQSAWDGTLVDIDPVDIGAASGDSYEIWAVVKDGSGATILESGHEGGVAP